MIGIPTAMPEGDTIWKHARTFEARYVGARVRQVLRGGVVEPRFRDATLTSAEAAGKHMTLRFTPAVAGDAVLVIRVHLGIAGAWHFGRRERYSRFVQTAARLLLDFGDELALVQKPKDVIIEREAFAPNLTQLGPDLLGDDPDLDEIVRRARLPRHAARPLGELLLDQTVAAGIGNVYKSELCFVTGQHPFLRVDEVPDEKLREIYTLAIAQLRSNLGPWRRTTTVDLSRGELPKAGRGRYFVYGRQLRACYRCGTRIVRKNMGPDLRGTFFCPTCQAP